MGSDSPEIGNVALNLQGYFVGMVRKDVDRVDLRIAVAVQAMQASCRRNRVFEEVANGFLGCIEDIRRQSLKVPIESPVARYRSNTKRTAGQSDTHRVE